MSTGLLSTQNFSIKFDKVNLPTFVNGPSDIGRETSISFSSTGANIKSEKAGELPGVCYSWGFSQARTSVVNTENKAIQSNGRKIQQQEPQMTIQTDVSTKGWGAHCNGISTGGNGRKKTETPHEWLRTNGCEICNPDFHKKFLKFNF